MALANLSDRLRPASPFALLFTGAVLAAATAASDGDLYWHLAAGREMAHGGALLTTDPFSVSAAGRPWTDVHWLFQLALYGLYQLDGLAALVFAKCWLVGSGALLLSFAIDRRDALARSLFAFLIVAALFAARHLLLVRPVILTLFFLAAYFLALERFRRDGRMRWLLPLFFVQALWVNCQSLFALGPAVIAAYAIGSAASAWFGERPWFPFAAESDSRADAAPRSRGLFLALALSIAGSCVTPFGLRALAQPAGLLLRLVPTEGNVYANVAENVPPFFLERVAPGQFWHLPWFFAVLGASFLVARRRVLLSHLCLVLGFGALALMANRNVLLFYWIATPVAAMNLAPAFHRALASLRGRRAAMAAPWVGRLAMASLVVLTGIAARREPPLGEPAPFHMPVESTRILERSPDSGAIFAADHYGGYLIWNLYPRFRPYLDTRLSLRSAAEFDEYLALAREPERFDAFQERHRFAYVLLPVAYPDRYCDLIAHFYSSAKWRLVFSNGAEVLFRARQPGEDDGWDLGATAVSDRILAAAAETFAGALRLLEAARLQLATLDIVVGELREADRVLDGVATQEAQALRARSRLLSADLEGAEEIGQRLLKADGDDVRTLDLLAAIYLRRGQHGQATKYLRRALSVDPLDGEATTILAALEEHHEPTRHIP